MHVDTYNIKKYNSLIHAYIKWPAHFEHFPLIDVGKPRSYERPWCGDKWRDQNNESIIFAFPWYNLVPNFEDYKIVEFLCFRLVLCKIFHDLHRDIGLTSDDIVHDWEKYRYNLWHVDHNPLSLVQRVKCDGEEVHNPPIDSQQNEWEIICGLYKNRPRSILTLDLSSTERNQISQGENLFCEWKFLERVCIVSIMT